MLDSRVLLKICAAVLAVAATLIALPGRAQAVESRWKAVVVVRGDGTRDGAAEMKRFARLLNPHVRPVIHTGQTGSGVPQDAARVWFGDLLHKENELLGVPVHLAGVAARVGRKVADRSADLVEGEVRLGVNCYSRNVDRSDGLPRIGVNFGEDDPQGLCKGLTISHVLSGAGRWMRDDVRGCLMKRCEMIMFASQK